MSSGGDGTAINRGDSPTRSPRSASISLQAAATVNAGLQHEPTRSTHQFSDIPGPGISNIVQDPPVAL